MKQKFLLYFITAVLLISLIPISAFAAAPAELKVFVRNTTGGVVDLKLTDADGGIHWMTLEAGVFETTLMEGKYEYYAVTPCGTQVGVWNLNVSKQLDIHCRDGVLEFKLAKRCDNNWWGTVYWLHPTEITVASAGTRERTLPFGFYVYNEKDFQNIHDWLLADGMPASFYVGPGQTMCWSDWLILVNGQFTQRDLGVYFEGITLD